MLPTPKTQYSLANARTPFRGELVRGRLLHGRREYFGSVVRAGRASVLGLAVNVKQKASSPFEWVAFKQGFAPKGQRVVFGGLREKALFLRKSVNRLFQNCSEGQGRTGISAEGRAKRVMPDSSLTEAERSGHPNWKPRNHSKTANRQRDAFLSLLRPSSSAHR